MIRPAGRLAALCALVFAVACSSTPGDGNGNGSVVDNGGGNGADNGGADNGGMDNGGMDNGGMDNGGMDNGGMDNGGMDNGGNGGDNGGDPPLTEAPLTAVVTDADSDAPLAGAEVVVRNAAGEEIGRATAGDDGAVEIPALPVEVTLHVSATAPGRLGAVIAVTLPQSQLMIPLFQQEVVMQGLMRSGTEPRAGVGFVFLTFMAENLSGGEMATLSSNSDTTVVRTATELIPGNTLVPRSDTIIFLNVDPGLTTVTVTAPAGTTCVVNPEAAAQFLVLADMATAIDVTCTGQRSDAPPALSATVIDDETLQPLAGAEVVVWDATGAEVGRSTADAEGKVSISGLPLATIVYVSASAAGFFGGVVATSLPNDTLQIEVTPEAAQTEVIEEAGAMRQAGLGVVFVAFSTENVNGGETATISSSSDVTFIIDDNDQIIAGDTVPPMTPEPTIVFTNVELGLLTVTITAPAGTTCTTGLGNNLQFLVLPDTITCIEVDCE